LGIDTRNFCIYICLRLKLSEYNTVFIAYKPLVIPLFLRATRTENMDSNPSEIMLQVIGKIPLFKGFSTPQVSAVLERCQHRVVEEREVLCLQGALTESMFFLVAGELEHITDDGSPLAKVVPVAPVGDIEALLNRTFTSTLQASKRSHVFSLALPGLKELLQGDLPARSCLYENLSNIAADRLCDRDESDLAGVAGQRAVQARAAVLQRQLYQQQQKLDLALELLAEKGHYGPGEAELHVADLLSHSLPRVLIVDDEPDFRHFVKEALASFMVVEARSGQEALDIISQERLDLIIADIRMPEMDGCTLLTNVRRQYPMVPVLAVSGDLEADDVQDYGFDGFIDKPVGLGKLQEIVEIALGR
jgi:CheY-like chemotaxis protein